MSYDYEREEEKEVVSLEEITEEQPFLDKTAEEENNDGKEKNNSEDYDSIYQKNGKPKNKIFSVLSVIFGVASIVISFFTVWGIVGALLTVGAALISRRSLGYFDTISIIGIILGAFAAVFPIALMILEPFISSLYS